MSAEPIMMPDDTVTSLDLVAEGPNGGVLVFSDDDGWWLGHPTEGGSEALDEIPVETWLAYDAARVRLQEARDAILEHIGLRAPGIRRRRSLVLVAPARLAELTERFERTAALSKSEDRGKAFDAFLTIELADARRLPPVAESER